MEVLDDQGRLFGVVNVVDALVVLFVLAIAIAGATLVFGGAGGPTQPGDLSPEQTSYAIVEFSDPVTPAATVAEGGDTFVPVDGGDNFTIEETAHSFTRNGQRHTVATVSYPGVPDVDGDVADASTQTGMRNESTTRSVRFLAVNESAPDLETETRPVVLALAENESVGQAVEPGASATVAGQTVATVESVTATPDGPPSRSELVGVELQAWNDGTRNWFGGRALRVNTRLTVVTDDAVISGRVYRIGTTDTDATTAAT